MSYITTKRDNYNDEVIFSVPQDELKQELVEELGLDIDVYETEDQDELNQVDELLDEYLENVDDKGWGFHKEFFKCSMENWKEDREVKSIRREQRKIDMENE